MEHKPWDVAVSFIQRHLSQAKAVSSLLQGRARVFVYSEHPAATVGTDGVDSYSNVFRRESTLVVVLLSSRWGATSFTQVEQTAITSRILEVGGDDFLMVVKMDELTVPAWLAPSRIYGHWRRLGAAGVADCIDARLKALGQEVRPETPIDLARRLEDQRGWAQRRLGFLTFENVQRERLVVLAEIERLAEETKCSISKNNFAVAIARDGFFATLGDAGDSAQLIVRLCSGELWEPHFSPASRELEKAKFSFDVEPPDVLGWRNGSQFLPSKAVAEFAVTTVLKRLLRDE